MFKAAAGPARRWVALPLLLVLAFTLSGCLRVNAALAVSTDDTVSGEVVVATLAGSDDDTGPELTVPGQLTSKVTTSAYNKDGYVGKTFKFEQLTFDEVRQLAENLTTASNKYRLNFRRSGDLVSLSGSADLNQIPADRTDFQVKVAFPGTIMQTNGVVDNGTVRWAPKPGGVTEISATVRYTDTSTVSWSKWVLLVSLGTVGVALLVALLAWIAHQRAIRQAQFHQAQRTDALL